MSVQDDHKLESGDDIEQLLRLAGRPDQPEPAAKLRARSQLRVTWRQSVEQHKARRWRKRTVPIGLAAAVILSLAGILQLLPISEVPKAIATIVHHSGEYTIESTHQKSADQVMQGDLLLTHGDGLLALQLADGTILHMDKSTQLTVKDDADVWLHTGRLYVDSPGQFSSLTVHTALGIVTDVGTQFELVAVDDALTITMREGTVNVALPQATGQPLVARAEGAVGDVVKIDGKFGVTKGSLATNDSAWDWTRTSTPPLPAGRYPLTDVIRWAARQSGRTVEYDQPITRLRAENEWVDWPEIPAVEIEQKLTELDDTTSDFLISFTRSEMVVTHR